MCVITIETSIAFTATRINTLTLICKFEDKRIFSPCGQRNLSWSGEKSMHHLYYTKYIRSFTHIPSHKHSPVPTHSPHPHTDWNSCCCHILQLLERLHQGDTNVTSMSSSLPEGRSWKRRLGGYEASRVISRAFCSTGFENRQATDRNPTHKPGGCFNNKILLKLVLLQRDCTLIPDN